MHFFVLVVTEEKPTTEVISKALAPFGPDGEDEWEWWEFGGRYSGSLIALDPDNTVSVRPGRLGRGVDALQVKNFDATTADAPFAVILDGVWYECEVFPTEASDRALGIEMTPEERDAERAAVARWTAKVETLLSSVPGEYWLAVVDCHF